jgi:hypothetical protein
MMLKGLSLRVGDLSEVFQYLNSNFHQEPGSFSLAGIIFPPNSEFFPLKFLPFLLLLLSIGYFQAKTRFKNLTPYSESSFFICKI